MKLTKEEMATVLFALRWWQMEMESARRRKAGEGAVDVGEGRLALIRAEVGAFRRSAPVVSAADRSTV